MPNGEHTFKHKGKTYDMSQIFIAAEAKDERYSAFGKETSFLKKLIELGFIVQDQWAFHPKYWIPLSKKERGNGFQTHKFTLKNGKVIFGTPKSLRNRKDEI